MVDWLIGCLLVDWLFDERRAYSYYIEVSMDQKDWIRVVDHSKHHCRQVNFNNNNNISANNSNFSTIDGNVEYVHSQYSCILTSQVSIQFLCPTKLSIMVIILEQSAYLTNKINTLFYLILENMSINVRIFRFHCYIWHL